MDQTDEQLAELCKAGDDAALQEIMRRYMAPLFSFARHYVQSPEEAEDIIQDTFFKTWKYIHKYTSGKSFKPWIYTIARNTALDFIKKRKIILFSDLDDAETDTSFEQNISDEGLLPSDIFERAESVTMVQKALDTLHPDHKTIMVMHYHEEMTFEDIAEIIGKPMNTVKSLHRRALIKMKKHVR